MYAVIQPDGPSCGIVVSRHRTRRAAERAIELEGERFRRSPYGRPSGGVRPYLDREIAPCGARDTRVRRATSRAG